MLLKIMEIFQEHPSSDSFYDSDGDAGSDLTTVERPGSVRTSGQHDEDIIEDRQRHDSSEVNGKILKILFLLLWRKRILF